MSIVELDPSIELDWPRDEEGHRLIITGPVGQEEKDSRRFYQKPSDPDFQGESITTITDDTTNKFALQIWYSNVAIESSIRNLNEFIQKLQVKPVFDSDGTFIGFEEPSVEGYKEALKFLKFEAEFLRNIASAIGVHQHDIMECLVKDVEIPDVPEELRGVEIDGERVDQDVISDGTVNFMVDHQIVPLMAEATVANTWFELAGTLDLMALFPNISMAQLAEMFGEELDPNEDPNRPAIIICDLKTGKNLYQKAIDEQLNAYKRCDEVWVDHIGTVMEMPRVDAMAVVHVRKDFHRGYKLRLVRDSDSAWERFLHRREVLRGGANDTKFVGTVVYPPMSDGRQPPPLIEDAPELSRCAQKLKEAGLTSVADFTVCSKEDVLGIKGVGPKAIEAIEELLAKHRIAFAVEVEPKDKVA